MMVVFVCGDWILMVLGLNCYQDMEEVSFEMRSLVHHVLYRHKAYGLQLKQVQEVLQVLEQPCPEETPLSLQQAIFQGILRFNSLHKDKVAAVLSEPRFAGVSLQVKVLLHKVLHQFDFLRSLKAEEVFRQGEHTSNTNPLPPLLDDEMEKAYLHYLYCGAVGMYSLGQVADPVPLPAYSAPSFDFARVERKPDYKPGRRGRPPNSSRQPRDQDNHQTSRPRVEPRAAQTERQFEPPKTVEPGCFCDQADNGKELLMCQCHQLFHADCSGSRSSCLACLLALADPFFRVEATLASCRLDWSKGWQFQEQVDFSSAVLRCSLEDYEVLASCGRAGEAGVCWPDDMVLEFDHQPVLQVPALLSQHAKSKRPDSAVAVTGFVLALARGEKIRVRLAVRPAPPQGPQRRNNRTAPFHLCFFLAKKITPQTLLQTVLEQNRDTPKVEPLNWWFQQEVPADRASLSLQDCYSRQLMEWPVRGSECEHLQCFDLVNFLQLTYQSSVREWRCPLCRRDCRRLVLDKAQVQLLRGLQDAPKKVTFFADGRTDLLYGEPMELQPEQPHGTD